MTLDDKRFIIRDHTNKWTPELYFEKDVKEFIKELKRWVEIKEAEAKEETMTEDIKFKNPFLEIIDKLAGDKLINSPISDSSADEDKDPEDSNLPKTFSSGSDICKFNELNMKCPCHDYDKKSDICKNCGKSFKDSIGIGTERANTKLKKHLKYCKKFKPEKVGCGEYFMNDESDNKGGFAPFIRRMCGFGSVKKPYLCKKCSGEGK